jgi:ATP-dependent RNA helicase SUPV3L1/SUV3
MNDGTFGTTRRGRRPRSRVVEAIENHRFDPLRDVQWRNSDLHFHSVPALIASLNRPPHHAACRGFANRTISLPCRPCRPVRKFLPRPAHAAARKAALGSLPGARFPQDDDGRAHPAAGPPLRASDQGGERLPEDWIESHIKRLEHFDGDIDTLMARIAHVRTWTYISHRPDWIQRSVHWQERARADRGQLSDVLHQRLTKGLSIDGPALLVRRLRDEGEMTTSVALRAR